MERIRIRKLNPFFRRVFGRKVHKVGLWGGFSCPNRDGTLSTEGCSFCNPISSRPVSWTPSKGVTEQLRDGCEYVAKRYGVSLFLPYFQDYTTTYGDPEELRGLYGMVLSHPGVVGLSLCTRPDCLGDMILDLLEEMASDNFIWVEIGVQTSNDAILQDMNRCHTSDDSMRAFERLHERGILSSAHMILGYPGMDEDVLLKDAEFVRKSGTAGVKLQNFHVVTDTSMQERYRTGEFSLPRMDEYVDMVIEFLEWTEPGVVVQRLSGEAPGSMTVAPEWSLRKMELLEMIWTAMEDRDSWQGKQLGYGPEALAERSIAEGFLPEAGTIAGTGRAE